MNSSGSQSKAAQYENFYCYRSPRFTEFITGYGDEETVAAVYIELLDGRRFLLSDLPEEEAVEVLKATKHPRGAGAFQTRVMGLLDHHTDSYSYLDYREGKLVSAKLHHNSGLFRISPHKEGPYLEFPIDRERLIEVFGEPLEWREIRRPTGP